MQLRHRNNIGKLTYSISGNAALAKSEIIFMDETPQAKAYQKQTGHPIGSDLYYQADGIFSTKEELDAYPHASGTQLGDIRVLDLDRNDTIDSRDPVPFRLFSYAHKLRLVLTVIFQYRNFDLNIFFRDKQGHINMTLLHRYWEPAILPMPDVSRAKDRWSVDNPNGSYAPGRYLATRQHSPSSCMMPHMSRLKTVELGYTIPTTITSRIRFNDVRFYVSAFNLLDMGQRDQMD